MAHHGPTQTHGAALNPVDAHKQVEHRAGGRQRHDHQHPDRGRARIALVDHCMAGRHQRGDQNRDAEGNVYRLMHGQPHGTFPR
jgi:hypothetical protein